VGRGGNQAKGGKRKDLEKQGVQPLKRQGSGDLAYRDGDAEERPGESARVQERKGAGEGEGIGGNPDPA